MKKIILFISVVVISTLHWNCKMTGDSADDIHWSDSVEVYKHQARMGDGDAYKKLAYCYHCGWGIMQDPFMALNMAIMSQKYGGLKNVIDFLEQIEMNIPLYKLVYAIEKVKLHQYDDARAVERDLMRYSEKFPGTKEVIEGAIALEQGQWDMAIHLFKISKMEKNLFGTVMLICYAGTNKDGMEIADLIPALFNVMANNAIKHDADSCKDIGIAAVYYLMADKQLSLDPQGARRLYDYYEYLEKEGKMKSDATTMGRLRILANKAGN